MTLLWLLVVIVFAGLTKVMWSRRRLRELAARIPGLTGPTLPLLGDALKIMGGAEVTFKIFRDALNRHGSTFRVWIGPNLWVLITDPEDAKIVLNTKRFQNRDIHFMRSMKSFLGDGLICSRYEKWKKHRKIANYAFKMKVLEHYILIFDKFSNILVKKLEPFADGNSFDVHSVAGLCNLDMTFETTLGFDREFQLKDIRKYLEGIERGTALINDKIFMPWLLIDWVLNLTQRGKEQEELQGIMRDEVESVVFQKFQKYNERRKQTGSNDFEQRKPSYIDMLLEFSASLGAGLTKDEIRDEVYTVFMAAQDTSDITNSLTLVLLALHPDHQDKVVQELNAIFGEDQDRPVTMEDLRQMEYLERVIKETLRLFPVIPVAPREIDEEVKLNTCTLPAGCTAMVFIYGTHRDPRIYAEPDQFDPDRFLPDRVQARHPYSFLGFGAGPRMCLGYRYAMLSMKTLLSTVLRRYRVLPACSLQDLEHLQIGFELKPVCGFPLKMLPRNAVP